ncbi:AlpA family phage regulatory protein [Enterobacter sp. A11]|uniref:helix-turn-helix transcriptional regulator n=1 Tax=unclassified Enterobacter TaxID=2608935 RepID=UPI00106FAC61|nr:MULTISPECIES: AlpA family phage regulatory protein [unclassified Enterobacter]MBM1020185.1 AlpA family phage regulatory protein [Enterobacter sp. E1]MEA3561486.1 AlpA family phage regulatory protein [Enterobacter sp. GM-22]MEA3595217.1 AlpA family phage regulatory protein [Enterobacter sp. GM-31]TFF60355.1 AlpA family phage regulatory protein [Enterobacter sp. A11]
MTKNFVQILRIPVVAKHLGVGKSTIYDWMNEKSPRYDPTFPRPIRLGKSSVGWLASELDEWLLNRANARG